MAASGREIDFAETAVTKGNPGAKDNRLLDRRPDLPQASRISTN
jgi:hypothetical protein